MTKKDYRIEIKVKNGLLWKAMQDFGHNSVASLSRASGIRQVTLGKYMNLRKPPIGKDARPTETATKLCDYFGLSIDELFPPEVILEGVQSNVLERWASSNEMVGISQYSSTPRITGEEEIIRNDRTRVINEVLDELPNRKADIIRLRFGLGEKNNVGMTLEQVAKKYDVSRERVREIESEVLRKLRHPSRAERLKLI